MQASAEHFQFYTLGNVSETVGVTCRAGSFFFINDSVEIKNQDIGKCVQIKNETNNSIKKEITD
jgi:hypothetical protein